MTHKEWAAKHAELFGLDADKIKPTLQAWAKLFEAEGYTPEQLLAASVWIAGHRPPRFLSDHLPNLVERLKMPRPSAEMSLEERAEYGRRNYASSLFQSEK